MPYGGSCYFDYPWEPAGDDPLMGWTLELVVGNLEKLRDELVVTAENSEDNATALNSLRSDMAAAGRLFGKIVRDLTDDHAR
jgi:hypothetical protein